MFAAPSDITSPTTKEPAAEVRSTEGTALPEWRRRAVAQNPDGTLFVALESMIPELQLSRDRTQLETDSFPMFQGADHETPELRAARDTRLALLARKYVAGASSNEDAARLHIATARLRALVPRVTEKDMLDLEEIVGETNSLDSLLEETRKRFGLTKK
jgi:hypothetical protein